MVQIPEAIGKLLLQYNGLVIDQLDKLPQAGSERQYYRVFAGNSTYIATHGTNLKENESFLYFSAHFTEKGLATPKVLCINEEHDVYLQEDLGDESLLNRLEAKGFTDEVYTLYQKSLQQLARLQVKGDEGLDYSKCLTNTVFGKQAIMADLLYFKYYFLDALRRPYDKQKLIEDFEALSNYLSHTEYQFFMFRDFQSRNIIIGKEESVHFIDYQGGMKGAPQYDLASLLWQAKANLPNTWKQSLLEEYITYFEAEVGEAVDREIFRGQYHGYVLIRLLQVLGAYGFRGLFERKAHFLTSIPLALQNLREFVGNQSIGIIVPEFKKILEICISDEVIREFTPVQADDNTALIVTINSFSYKKGIPEDPSENGGGYVFDMRGILNPGRMDEYKRLSGLDKPVKDFLEQQTRMPDFLNNVYNLVDITVSDYIDRNFASLVVNFGCTGGQHRSVYAAEALARHLRNKFRAKVNLNHTNKTNWVG